MDETRWPLDRFIDIAVRLMKTGYDVVLTGIASEKPLTAKVAAASTAAFVHSAADNRPAIVDLAGNVPYDVQRLAHETWDDLHQQGRRTATLDDLHATLTRLLAEQHTVYEEAWQRLTLAQRGVLRALVLEDGREMLSGDVRTRHRLGGTSSVQSALTALVKQDVVMKDGASYVMTDSLYREWVARKTF